jgi:hypothetical protein
MPVPVSVIATSTNWPGDFRILPAIGFVQIRIGGFDRQFAAARHGVARIDRDVEDRALELLRVRVHSPQTGRPHGLDLGVFSQCRLQQIGHVNDHFVSVERLWFQRLLPRERQEPLREDRGTLGRVGGGSEKPLNAEVAFFDAA